MEIKILQVFYDKNGLPYKDKERTVHYPITSGTFLGASNTTQIRFYYDQLDELNESTFVAVSKLPNGKIGSEILESAFDEELNENYVTLSLSQFYTQYKGDVYVSLQGYQGGVRVEQDENGIYQIYGTPTIQATGSIKLSIAYAPTFIGSGETENITLQRVLAELSTKLGIRQETLHVEELPTVGNPNVWYVINDDPNDTTKANIYIWNATTQTYVWVGDNTLDLGNYYTQEQGEQFESGVNNRVTSVENELSSVAQGSPKGVYATLEDLQSAFPTGTTGIYVVSANGHWYYWNGSAWTDGGIYLSTANAVPDTRIVGDVQLNQDIPSSLLEKTLGLKDFKDGFKSKDIFNQAYRKGADGTYVYASDGHVTYNASSYNLYTFILKIDGTKTYTFSGSCTFAVLLKADLYTCASSVLTSTSRIDCSQYADAEYLVFTLENTQTTIISEGQYAIQGYELPKWFTNEVSPYKTPMKKVYASTMNNAAYIRTDIRTNLRKNEIVVFKARFTSGNFNDLQIGINYAEGFGVAYRRNYFVITNSTISYYKNQDDTNPQVENHGLTLENEITVIGEYLDNGQYKLTLKSMGLSYTMTISYYYKLDIGQYFAFSEYSSLTDCTLSWTCKDIKQKIWFFGDSYIAYEMDRWAYYLHDAGYDKNCLLDGFPGESSPYAITSLGNLLKVGTPKFAIWCMGMNDGTDASDTTPNSQWATNRDLFLNYCQENNITPIFATIPNVPSINNKGKNYWIRNSGHRYIDMAKAVGSDISTSWYSGMQASDQVHPSWKGAIALFSQVLVDLPEIMVNDL